MRHISLLLILLSILSSDIILVPSDYPTIQEAIDASSDNDTVLISAGTYYENINFNSKNISVIGEDRETTIIDGNLNNECIVTMDIGGNLDTPTEIGELTITNGLGGICTKDYINVIIRDCEITNSAPTTYPYLAALNLHDSSIDILNCNINNNRGNLRGGIEAHSSEISIIDSRITHNSGSFGGGCFFSGDNSSITLAGTTISHNHGKIYAGGIFANLGENSTLTFDSSNLCDIYSNYAGNGNDILAVFSSEENESNLHVEVDTFTVADPTMHNILVVYEDWEADNIINPESLFTYNINYGYIDQVNADLYVAPNGSNDNSGLDSDMPLATISFALNKIISDEENPKKIHLLEGTYAPETNGECPFSNCWISNEQYYPLNAKSNISIIGNHYNTTIMDIDSVYSAIFATLDTNVYFSNITIKNSYSGFGAVLLAQNSEVIMDNVLLHENYGEDGSVLVSSESDVTFLNSTITNNTSDDEDWDSGIMETISSNITIINSILFNNHPNYIIDGNEIAQQNNPNYSPGQFNISYSDIEGGESSIHHIGFESDDISVNWNESNIDADPMFVNDNNYQLQENSPCIDSGTSDLNDDGIEDITNYYGIAPDMGVYEYCSEGLGDLNNDWVLDISDIIQMVDIIMGFTTPILGEECKSDMNQDGNTNLIDILILVNIILNQ